jgi:hypothetical protein
MNSFKWIILFLAIAVAIYLLLPYAQPDPSVGIAG